MFMSGRVGLCQDVHVYVRTCRFMSVRVGLC